MGLQINNPPPQNPPNQFDKVINNINFGDSYLTNSKSTWRSIQIFKNGTTAIANNSFPSTTRNYVYTNNVTGFKLNFNLLSIDDTRLISVRNRINIRQPFSISFYSLLYLRMFNVISQLDKDFILSGNDGSLLDQISPLIFGSSKQFKPNISIKILNFLQQYLSIPNQSYTIYWVNSPDIAFKPLYSIIETGGLSSEFNLNYIVSFEDQVNLDYFINNYSKKTYYYESLNSGLPTNKPTYSFAQLIEQQVTYLLYLSNIP